MDKGCKANPMQGKDFCNSQKVRKVVIYKTNKQTSSL